MLTYEAKLAMLSGQGTYHISKGLIRLDQTVLKYMLPLQCFKKSGRKMRAYLGVFCTVVEAEHQLIGVSSRQPGRNVLHLPNQDDG